MDLRAELKAAAIEAVDIEPLGGGCVSAVYLLHLAGGERLVAKLDESGGGASAIEAGMLRYLAANTALPVPMVRHVGEHLLLLEYLSGGSRFNREAEHHAAELLAALHGISADAYGFDFDTLIGGLHQPNTLSTSWIDFFRQQRLLYMASEAMHAGLLPPDIFQRIESFSRQLEKWLFEPEQPSLIHGDVWTTNVLALGNRITGFLDPAIYFAHAEIELAFTTLFHTFGREFYDRYAEIRPIAPGFFEERCDIYNLYPLLVHVRLFGGAYVSSVTRTLEKYGY